MTTVVTSGPVLARCYRREPNPWLGSAAQRCELRWDGVLRESPPDCTGSLLWEVVLHRLKTTRALIEQCLTALLLQAKVDEPGAAERGWVTKTFWTLGCRVIQRVSILGDGVRCRTVLLTESERQRPSGIVEQSDRPRHGDAAETATARATRSRRRTAPAAPPVTASEPGHAVVTDLESLAVMEAVPR